MYDTERIGKIVADIEKYLTELDSYKITNKDSLFDGKTYNASAMVVFAILNRVIDLGGEIISAENLGAPNSYQDIIPLLIKAGVINKIQGEKLNFLIKKRNVLAHFYEDISEKDLFNMIREIGLIKKFIVIMALLKISNKKDLSCALMPYNLILN